MKTIHKYLSPYLYNSTISSPTLLLHGRLAGGREEINICLYVTLSCLLQFKPLLSACS